MVVVSGGGGSMVVGGVGGCENETSTAARKEAASWMLERVRVPPNQMNCNGKRAASPPRQRCVLPQPQQYNSRAWPKIGTFARRAPCTADAGSGADTGNYSHRRRRAGHRRPGGRPRAPVLGRLGRGDAGRSRAWTSNRYSKINHTNVCQCQTT